MRRTHVVAVLLVVIVALALSGAFSGPADDPPTSEVPEASLVDVAGDHQLWPYTSRRESVAGRTLAINVVFRNDADAVREAMTTESAANWETQDEPDGEIRADVAEAVTTDWEAAHGSTRYSYFEGPERERGEWVAVTFELHDGEYLGARDHVRAYESPDGTYTAVQVHEEYYDWFRLRHTVTGIDDPSERLEDEFIAADLDADVAREYHAIEGGWSDGWLSVIELLVAVPLVGALLRRRTREATLEAARRFRVEARRHGDAAVLGAALAAVVLGVRAAGIGLELAYPDVAPKVIAAPLYLVVVLGPPAIAIGVAKRCEPAAAFLGVVVGLGAGFVLDFAGLGVAIPPNLVVHRTALLAALGLVATGRAAEDRPVLVAGLLAWVVGIMLPLADVI